jgi:hypothetical protein
MEISSAEGCREYPAASSTAAGAGARIPTAPATADSFFYVRRSAPARRPESGVNTARACVSDGREPITGIRQHGSSFTKRCPPRGRLQGWDGSGRCAAQGRRCWMQERTRGADRPCNITLTPASTGNGVERDGGPAHIACGGRVVGSAVWNRSQSRAARRPQPWCRCAVMLTSTGRDMAIRLANVRLTCSRCEPIPAGPEALPHCSLAPAGSSRRAAPNARGTCVPPVGYCPPPPSEPDFGRVCT